MKTAGKLFLSLLSPDLSRSQTPYLHLAIASVLRTYLPELRIPRRWSEDCFGEIFFVVVVEVEVEKKTEQQKSRRSKLVKALCFYFFSLRYPNNLLPFSLARPSTAVAAARASSGKGKQRRATKKKAMMIRCVARR